jgi:hypothetical protein
MRVEDPLPGLVTLKALVFRHGFPP